MSPGNKTVPGTPALKVGSAAVSSSGTPNRFSNVVLIPGMCWKSRLWIDCCAKYAPTTQCRRSPAVLGEANRSSCVNWM